MITNTFNQEEGILYSIRSGKVTLDEFMQTVEEIGSSTQLPRRLLTITDASNSDLDIGMDDLPIILEQLQKHLPNYESIHDAVIHNDAPTDVAIGIFFEKVSSVIPNYKFKIFTTIEAAKHWLLTFK